MAISDRSFKVRSGKILKKFKDTKPQIRHSMYHIITHFDTLGDIVNNYFDNSTDSSRFLREYNEEIFAIINEQLSNFLGIKKDVASEPAKPIVLAEKPTRKPRKDREPKKLESKKPEPKKLKIEFESEPLHLTSSSSKTYENTDIVFSFDDTGSMSACRRIVRDLIDKISAELLVACGDSLNVGVMIHGDYCDPVPDPCVSLDLGKDWVKIKRFLEEKRQFHGGDAPECYELVLNRAKKMNWRVNANKILAVIGDEVPHDARYRLNKDGIDYEKEIQDLSKMGVKIVSIQAMNNRYAEPFYSHMAKATDGYHLRLTQLNQISDLLKAICYNSSGKLADFEALSAKVESFKSQSFRRNIDILAGRTSSPLKVDGLTEFQMFTVDRDASIRDFVIDLGLNFTRGCGYYEFTKPEIVQDYKKVVVQDRNTEVFYPDKDGRDLLRLPSTGTVKINPKNYDKKYRFFIQSTSNNRVLKSGTTFLYDCSSMV